MTAIWNNRKARLLLAANLISAIGSGISGIGISWLLIQQPHGESIFGLTTLGITILLFFLSPYIGVIVDRYSRKALFLLIHLICAAIILANVGIALAIGRYATAQLIVLLLTASLYYNFYFPTLMAFSQEVFHRSMFKKLNSLLEVQNQTASIVSGGAAGLILSLADYTSIFLFDALTFLASFFLIFSIRYTPVPSVVDPAQRGLKTFFANVFEGVVYLKSRPWFAMFLLCSTFPFLVVMVSNYLMPIYVSNTLHADAGVFGTAEMTYAIGAVAAGLVLPLVFAKLKEDQSILLTVVLFTVGTFLIPLFPSGAMLIAAYTMLGFGNAGTRITRNTIMMETVPAPLIGRVNSFFQSAGLFIRIALLSSFTYLVTNAGTSMAWWISAFFMVIAVAGIVLGRKSVSFEIKWAEQPRTVAKD